MECARDETFAVHEVDIVDGEKIVGGPLHLPETHVLRGHMEYFAYPAGVALYSETIAFTYHEIIDVGTEASVVFGRNDKTEYKAVTVAKGTCTGGETGADARHIFFESTERERHGECLDGDGADRVGVHRLVRV